MSLFGKTILTGVLSLAATAILVFCGIILVSWLYPERHEVMACTLGGAHHCNVSTIVLPCNTSLEAIAKASCPTNEIVVGGAAEKTFDAQQGGCGYGEYKTVCEKGFYESSWSTVHRATSAVIKRIGSP